MRKTICALILAGASLLGCDKGEKYYFEGDIGKENVAFNQCYVRMPEIHRGGRAYVLKVTEPDGKKIYYIDLDNHDMKLDHVVIMKEDKKLIYAHHIKEEKVLIDQAQVKFDDYLKQILEAKQEAGKAKLAEGLEDIK